jgi:hypothetical protein
LIKLDRQVTFNVHHFIQKANEELQPRRKMYGRNRRDPAHFRCIPLERTGNTPEDGSSIPAGIFTDFFQ